VRLEELGDGVFQALTIAAAIIVLGRGVLLLEEPDVGLHPRAQRGLVDTLLAQRSIQSVLTTHSNHVVDHRGPGVEVFGVRKRGGARVVERAMAGGLRSLLEELGARPSSVLFVNATVWVEGPSDVRTLGHWLSLLGSRQHVDYEFVAFGGDNIDKTSLVSDDDDAPDASALAASGVVVHDRDGRVRGQDGPGDLLPGLLRLV